MKKKLTDTQNMKPPQQTHTSDAARVGKIWMSLCIGAACKCELFILHDITPIMCAFHQVFIFIIKLQMFVAAPTVSNNILLCYDALSDDIISVISANAVSSFKMSEKGAIIEQKNKLLSFNFSARAQSRSFRPWFLRSALMQSLNIAEDFQVFDKWMQVDELALTTIINLIEEIHTEPLLGLQRGASLAGARKCFIAPK
ncbi:hypothetical protein CHS0354_006287 [Potamilus streckersoni]|uniref:Uncharacterized protein n=1 Tax=Potamilus streckersoni TaxID=2493646 RepID=A0AAE0VPJ1_9BIVA|nr:hypothetical protein CHS0354_006287 [Potamilus streckersoni]